MNGQRCRKKDSAQGAVKPVLIGAGAAVACMLIIIAAVSLVTVIIRNVTHSSVLPLALAAAGVGCAIGGLICARMVRKDYMLYGALIGLAVFVVIWLVGLCFTKPVFGTENAVKLIVLIMCGCFGGYAGGRSKPRRR